MLSVLHAMQQALMAHTLKRVDVDYVVRPGDDGSKEVVIVDELSLPPVKVHCSVLAEDAIKAAVKEIRFWKGVDEITGAAQNQESTTLLFYIIFSK